MIKLLVTGANGQLGSAIKNISSDYHEFDFFYSDLPELDITDSKKTEQFISGINPSFIINCAAYTAVDRAEEDRETAFMVNADIVRILSEQCAKNNIKLIHISTDYVFKGDHYKPYKEDDATDPVSIYGLSKLKGEKFLSNKDYSLIIRTSWLYSASHESFVSKILARSSRANALKVVNDQVGSPTYAPDLARTILEIIRKTEKELDFVPGIYHYTNEGVTSWYDFAVEILKYSGSDCPVIPVESSEFPTPAKRPHYSVLSKQKIKTTYNIDIPYWRDSLAKCLDTIKNKS